MSTRSRGVDALDQRRDGGSDAAALFWLLCSSLTERRKSAVIPTGKGRFARRKCPTERTQEMQIFGVICLPSGLDMKSVMVTLRRPCHPSNLPNALRAAARAILEEAGPDAVGLRETARRVGVSTTAAYRHFANKEIFLRRSPRKGSDSSPQRWRGARPGAIGSAKSASPILISPCRTVVSFA